MDKIKQNRHGVREKGRGREVKSYLLVLLNFRFFIYLFILFIFQILPSVGIMVIKLFYLFYLFSFIVKFDK